MCLQDVDVRYTDVLHIETMAVFVIGGEDCFHQHTDIKNVINGKQVLKKCPLLQQIQKVLMELDGKKTSLNIFRLKIQLQIRFLTAFHIFVDASKKKDSIVLMFVFRALRCAHVWVLPTLLCRKPGN